MNLMWSIPFYLALAKLATLGGAVVDKWEEVGFGLTHIMSSSELVVSNMKTGCTISQTGIQLECKDSKSMISGPSNAFQTVVNCQNMDPTKATSVRIKGSDSCGKLTYTQHFAVNESVSSGSGSVEIEQGHGQVVNLTCVLLPFPTGNSARKLPEKDNFATSNDVKLDFSAQHYDEETKRLQGGSSSVSIGTVRFLQDTEKVTSSSCSAAVDALFDWKLSLTDSNQNVHNFLWSSQPVKPSASAAPKVNLQSLPSKITASMKDLGFYDLQPSITKAICGTSLTNFAEKVKLKVEKLPEDVKIPEKHEEVVKMIVDATQLPTCSELKVEVKYTIPEQDARYVEFLLPVANPNVPDDQPQEPQKGKDSDSKDKPEEPKDKKGSKKSGASKVLETAFWSLFWTLIAGGLLAAILGGFLYRRNRLIQENARALQAVP